MLLTTTQLYLTPRQEDVIRRVLAHHAERQPALDYTSLETLANFLGKLFWADLERHHPGIDSLHLAAEVADNWKQRLRTFTKTIHSPDGQMTETTVPRINYRECLTPVRASYLDLAHWAVEDPARWARESRHVRSDARRSTGRKTSVAASPGWTLGRVSGYRSCLPWSAPSTNAARTPLHCSTRLAAHHRDRRSPRRDRP